MHSITIVADDRVGLLADISYILGTTHINIESISVSAIGGKAVITLLVKNPEKAEADAVFSLSADLNFPAASEACRIVGNETRSVLVKGWRNKEGQDRGAEIAEKLHREKHLSATDCRAAQRYSVNLYQGEFLDAQRKGYIYQPAEDWNFWVWNSDYDDNVGLGHLDAGAFIQ